MKEAIGSTFFKSSTDADGMAANTLIALKYHGLIDDECSLTEIGFELVNAPTAIDALEIHSNGTANVKGRCQLNEKHWQNNEAYLKLNPSAAVRNRMFKLGFYSVVRPKNKTDIFPHVEKFSQVK